MPENFVVASNLIKKIKGQTIVQEISFQLEEGSIVGLCGGNGAGKSTVLRMIAGILQPTSGEIVVNRIQWKNDRKKFAEQMGYMPDDFQFPQGMTAQEILSFWAALRKVPEQRVHEVLSFVGLADKKNKPVSSFSKGMRQRVLFAQSILAKPALLIMDEPTNGLDPYWMKEFVNLIRMVKSEGQTVLFSTHQLDIAEELADYVIFLHEGQNCGEGAVEEYRQLFGDYPLHKAFQHSMELVTRNKEEDDDYET
ncbi:ABC-type multidrug transport system ATPase subunit [Fontibacillus phaseoli]|uniref:ABC-type multidrug transport system ATPase subunit n=1 Tax=Fontibacillus phaseoli TaxID=1416533 RepID=A0A369BQB3_9BACL|nr:ABC transporter ATP-binding protein [Fontibacillus phaseoli]RCX23743.1 ABC-type multidrug transport system ATPase subunit [Fontibacillus phaseoli]